MSTPLRIDWAVTDAYKGQVNERASAWKGDDCVGYLDMTVFKDKPSISYIEVDAFSRRQGIASALVRSLQNRFPHTELEWGLTTPDASAFRKALPCRQVVDHEVRMLRLSLENAVATRDGYEAKYAAFQSIEKPDAVQVAGHRAWMSEVGEKWNQAHDLIWDVEEQLRTGPPEVTQIIVERADSLQPLPADPSVGLYLTATLMGPRGGQLVQASRRPTGP